jgi:hypothetical protein
MNDSPRGAHTRLVVFIFTLLGIFLGCFYGAKAVRGYFRNSRQEAAELNWYRTQYRAQGGPKAPPNAQQEVLSYEIWSYDGGKTWHAIRTEGHVQAVGAVDAGFRALLQQIQGQGTAVGDRRKNSDVIEKAFPKIEP